MSHSLKYEDIKYYIDPGLICLSHVIGPVHQEQVFLFVEMTKNCKYFCEVKGVFTG